MRLSLNLGSYAQLPEVSHISHWNRKCGTGSVGAEINIILDISTSDVRPGGGTLIQT